MDIKVRLSTVKVSILITGLNGQTVDISRKLEKDEPCNINMEMAEESRSLQKNAEVPLAHPKTNEFGELIGDEALTDNLQQLIEVWKSKLSNETPVSPEAEQPQEDVLISKPVDYPAIKPEDFDDSRNLPTFGVPAIHSPDDMSDMLDDFENAVLADETSQESLEEPLPAQEEDSNKENELLPDDIEAEAEIEDEPENPVEPEPKDPKILQEKSEEFIKILQDYNVKHGKSPTIFNLHDEITALGLKVQTHEIVEAFGTWENAIAKACLPALKLKYDAPVLIEQLGKLKKSIHRIPSWVDIQKASKRKKTASTRTYQLFFGGLKKANEKAGNYITRKSRYTDDFLLEKARELKAQLGRNPSSEDLNKAAKTGQTGCSTTYLHHFRSLKSLHAKL